MGNLNKIRILQWNCRGINNKKGNFERIIHNYDIILLNETWLKQKNNFALKKCTIIRKDFSKNIGGGLIIAVRSDLPFTSVFPFEIPELLDSLAISIPSNWGELLIVNINRKPKIP